MRRVDVLILIEHKGRELESAVVLKKSLEESGLTCELFSYGYSKRYAQLFYCPRMIILPFLYDERDINDLILPFIIKNKLSDLVVVNMHQEQIGNINNKELLLPKEDALFCYHIAWGKKFAIELERIGVPKPYIYTLGNIRLDFYKKELSVFSSNKFELSNKYHLNIGKKWVLYISSFSIVSETEENLINLYERGYRSIYEYHSVATETYNIMKLWIIKYLDKNHDKEFIYRPHPSEVLSSDLLSIKEKYKNFHIIKDESIRDWILNSDYIDLWISTSIAEIIAAKKPFRVIRPIKIDEGVDVELFHAINAIDNINDYINNKSTRDDSENKAILDRINDYYLIENSLAFPSISKLLIELLNKHEECLKKSIEEVNNWKGLKRIIYRMKIELKYIAEIIRVILNRQKTIYKYLNNEAVYNNRIIRILLGPTMFKNDNFSKALSDSLEQKYEDAFKRK